MNTQNPAPGSAEAAKQQFAKEITELEKRAFEKGRAMATGVSPGVDVAVRMAERAAALRVANPQLSNAAAVKQAYAEAGEKLE